MKILLALCMLVDIVVITKADSVSSVSCVQSAFFIVCTNLSILL